MWQGKVKENAVVSTGPDHPFRIHTLNVCMYVSEMKYIYIYTFQQRTYYNNSFHNERKLKVYRFGSILE